MMCARLLPEARRPSPSSGSSRADGRFLLPVLALLVGALSPFAETPAAAQAALWPCNSATPTISLSPVSKTFKVYLLQGASKGCDSRAGCGHLRVVHENQCMAVSHVALFSGNLTVSFTADYPIPYKLPNAFWENAILKVGNRSFALSAAANAGSSATSTAPRWVNTGLSWRTNQSVTMSIGLVEATLEGVFLLGSTDGSSFQEALTLSPPFAADTRDYVATAASSVTHVELAPSIGFDSHEAIVYRADDEAGATTLSADNSAARFALGAGNNVFRIVVTHTVTTSQKLYTVTVTRQGGGGPPPTGGPGGPPPDDDDEDEPSTCTLVAPYWSGPSGGFTVMPEPGRTSVSATCGGTTTEYSAENGLVTRLVRGSCPGGLRLEGAAPGGWYWQHGERNAAAAPFVCSEALGGPRAVVPGGVAADATANGTWFKHDTARLVGIVPHLEGNECSEYVSPYWQGDGGVVVRPAEGRSTARVKVQCGRTYSTLTASPGADGVAAELVRKDYCTDDEGEPIQGKLTVTGAAPGGWYWISGERNAAVAPLMCADLLGGPAAVDPGGVLSRSTDDGTYFSHDTSRLIGVVPHVASDRDE